VFTTNIPIYIHNVEKYLKTPLRTMLIMQICKKELKSLTYILHIYLKLTFEQIKKHIGTTFKNIFFLCQVPSVYIKKKKRKMRNEMVKFVK
jgi:hypothetical protein